MRGVARWARQHYQFLGELTSKTARAVRVLRIFNTVLEFVAKWAFVLDIAVVFTQFTVEVAQREQMIKQAIRSYDD